MHMANGFQKKAKRGAMLCAALTLMAAPGAFAAGLNNPFFSRTQVASHDISPFAKWTAVLPRYEQQRHSAEESCTGDACMPRQWEALITRLQGKPVKTQIDAVNRFFNAVTYIEDADNWGMEDYWATPYEFMSRGGDCEDYAIAKLITLKRLGVPESSMRVVIVQDYNLGGIIHAVLEVKSQGVPYLLDNQATEVVSEAKVFHYQPVYAINDQQWWAYQ